MEEKERAIKEVIEQKKCAEEELKRKIRDQDKEKQSELIKLQMEVDHSPRIIISSHLISRRALQLCFWTTY